MKRCIVCHSKKIKKYFVANSTQYFECQDCTHVFAYKVSNANYDEYFQLEKYTKWKEYLHNIFEKRVRDIEKIQPNGRVLEVGSSVGYMLDIFKQHGYQVEGLEPSADGVNYCNNRGLVAHLGYLEKNNLKAKGYDVVALNHVFEHMKDLDVSCRNIKRLLKKEGVVFIECPNFNSLEASVLKGRWRFLQPHEHYSQFSPKSMKKVLEKNGFEIVLLKTNSPIFDFASPFQEFLRCLKHDQKRFIYYLIELPLAILEFVVDRGKTVEVIARSK